MDCLVQGLRGNIPTADADRRTSRQHEAVPQDNSPLSTGAQLNPPAYMTEADTQGNYNLPTCP